MSVRLMGQVGPPRVTRDESGHRDYRVTFRVVGGSRDGPLSALQCPGLPLWGTQYALGNDLDLWAWCRWDATVEPVVGDEPTTYNYYNVGMLFSSKPPGYGQGGLKYCKDSQYEDPLLQPQKVSGSFAKEKEEASHDRYGNPILNSAFEEIRGPKVEFDKYRPGVHIEQNVIDLELPLITAMNGCVNAFPLWGVPARCIKLEVKPWEKKWYGTCYAYYTRVFEFDINYDTFDKNILDEGTKALNGKWDDTTGLWTLINIPGQGTPNYLNPQHYKRYTDRDGNPARVILNGKGQPAGTLGDGTSIVAAGTPLTSSTISSPANPSIPCVLAVKISAPSSVTAPFSTFATFQIYGTDRNDKPINESFSRGPGSLTTYTRSQFKTLTLILVTRFDAPSGATYQIDAQDTATAVGKIHVAKYDEADFTLLGISTSL